MKEVASFAADFDNIAELPNRKWDHNSHFFSYISGLVPDSVNLLLEVGCGQGDLLEILSRKFNRGIGMDISENMIRNAKNNCENTSIDFLHDDYLKYQFNENSIDVIVTVATVHHLNFESFLHKAKKELKPGGKLIILDLYEVIFMNDILSSIISKSLDFFYNIIYNRRIWSTEIEKKYWKEHSNHDSFLTIQEIKNKAQLILPFVQIRKHLFWRYSLIWEK